VIDLATLYQGKKHSRSRLYLLLKDQGLRSNIRTHNFLLIKGSLKSEIHARVNNMQTFCFRINGYSSVGCIPFQECFTECLAFGKLF
jgi:hypothetical protein